MSIAWVWPVLLLFLGCSTYHHSYVGSDGGKDDTRFGSFLMMGNAAKIHSLTKLTNGYSRSVSVGSLAGQTDPALIEAIVAGVVAGMKK